MNTSTLLLAVLTSFSLFIYKSCNNGLSDYEQLKSSNDWQLQFSDSCSGDWKDQWFLDGKLATINNTENGMDFRAGPVNRNDAHHAVLWTKESFAGDIKIEYNYTRTDSQIVNVNILYIQATGIGTGQFAKDISKWDDYREVPTMSKYYDNMKALHISYAAFNMNNEIPKVDYVRVRKYPATEEIPFSDTEVPPSYDITGLFEPYVTYKITVTKTNSKLYFQVEGDSDSKLFTWELYEEDPITDGRIGLRHMFTRSASYSNFNVYTKRKH